MESLVALLVGLLTLYPKHVVEFLNKVIDARIAEHFTVIAQFLVVGLSANGPEEGAQ